MPIVALLDIAIIHLVKKHVFYGKITPVSRHIKPSLKRPLRAITCDLQLL